jgi:hypothetical protein
MVRKIPPEYENFIDDVLIDWAEKSVPRCSSLCLTPNQVTVLSIFFGVVAVWSLWDGKTTAFFASFFLSVWLDYLDGCLARSTGAVTKIGDFLDHCSDVLLTVGIAIVIAVRRGYPRAILPLLAIALFMSLANVHLGLQQRYYADHGKDEDEHEETLDALKNVSPEDYHWWLPISRWFGVGTAQTAVALIAWHSVLRRR